MNSKKNERRRFICVRNEAHSCDVFVWYDHLELAKAKRLFEKDPMPGATGEWYRLYKSC